jgi:hypothetical protein
MIYKFLPQLPSYVVSKPELLSGPNSVEFQNVEYLIIETEAKELAFEIRYQYHCSSFKEAVILDNTLGVGHEEHFYLFDLATGSFIRPIEFPGYFGRVYVDEKLFYVAGDSELYCLDINGAILWKTSALGIDGVIVNKIDSEFILGAGEWDPPAGWRNFKLNKFTGHLIK